MIISIIGTKYNDNNVLNLNHLIHAKTGISVKSGGLETCLWLEMTGNKTIQIQFNTEEECRKALDFILDVSH